MSTTTTPEFDTAARRVDSTPSLQPYRDLLVEYCWPNQDEHLIWVATAPEAEIISWAEDCRRDEANEAA